MSNEMEMQANYKQAKRIIIVNYILNEYQEGKYFKCKYDLEL